MSILVKNRLEVKPGRDGGVISVPGCEPTSSLTSTGLLKNIDCKASVISVKVALRVIPGSKLVRVTKPIGSYSTGMFFELPSGPPPNGEECPHEECPPDWYKILKQNSEVVIVEKKNGCVGYNFSGCPVESDPRRRAPDPEMRPNSRPLSTLY